MKGLGKGLEERLRELSSLKGYGKLPLGEGELYYLDANENLLIPLEELSPILLEAAEELDPRIYPRDLEEAFTEALSKKLGIRGEYILLGNGCDELIDLLVRAFTRRGEELLTIAPTFSMYRWSAELNGTRYVEVPLEEDFSLNASNLLSHAGDGMLCILCSPNNPTGNQFRREEVLKVVEGFQGLVAVDETYSDFASYNLLEEVGRYENLVILRTFSKTFGLAGLRLGYMVADPKLIETVKGRARLPWSINSYVLLVALKLLDRPWIVEKAIETVKRERERVVEELEGIDGICLLYTSPSPRD